VNHWTVQETFQTQLLFSNFIYWICKQQLCFNYDSLLQFAFILAIVVILFDNNNLDIGCDARWAAFGVYDQAGGMSQDKILAMDNWVGKQSSLQLVFTTFQPTDVAMLWSSLSNIYSTGKVPIISLQPIFNSVSTRLIC